jgi:hypothetical protein
LKVHILGADDEALLAEQAEQKWTEIAKRFSTQLENSGCIAWTATSIRAGRPDRM